MFEHIVQMGPMLVLAGLIAGWVAEAASRAGGYGFVLDMFLGLIGSVVGGATVWGFDLERHGDAGDAADRQRRGSARHRRSAGAVALRPTRNLRAEETI